MTLDPWALIADPHQIRASTPASTMAAGRWTSNFLACCRPVYFHPLNFSDIHWWIQSAPDGKQFMCSSVQEAPGRVIQVVVLWFKACESARFQMCTQHRGCMCVCVAPTLSLTPVCTQFIATCEENLSAVFTETWGVLRGGEACTEHV